MEISSLLFLQNLGDALFEKYEEVLLPAKHVLIKEGDTSTNIYLVKQGALRVWTESDGEEITVQFIFENQMVSSFLGIAPSSTTVETIEPSLLKIISIDDFKKIADTVPGLKDKVLELAMMRIKHYCDLFISRIKYSPQQRYRNLQENNPEILQRIPQRYIATYLGITPVSLSRIRARVCKQSKI